MIRFFLLLNLFLPFGSYAHESIVIQKDTQQGLEQIAISFKENIELSSNSNRWTPEKNSIGLFKSKKESIPQLKKTFEFLKQSIEEQSLHKNAKVTNLSPHSVRIFFNGDELVPFSKPFTDTMLFLQNSVAGTGWEPIESHSIKYNQKLIVLDSKGKIVKGYQCKLYSQESPGPLCRGGLGVLYLPLSEFKASPKPN